MQKQLVPILPVVLCLSACQFTPAQLERTTASPSNRTSPSQDNAATVAAATPVSTSDLGKTACMPNWPEATSIALPPIPKQPLTRVSEQSIIDASWQKGPFYSLPSRRHEAPTAARKTAQPDDNWGMGHLRIEPLDNIEVSWWPLNYIVLPLYDAPQGNPQGWIACGRVVQSHADRVDAPPLQHYVLETSYQIYSFIVLEQSGNWLRIRYSATGPIGEGTAWIHQDHLQFGDAHLTFIPWEEELEPSAEDFTRYAGNGGHYFRHGGISSALRQKPAQDAAVVTAIGENHGFDILKIQGDWMYVRVMQPTSYCESEWDGTVHQGWIRWQDNAQGNRIYYYPRGC